MKQILTPWVRHGGDGGYRSQDHTLWLCERELDRHFEFNPRESFRLVIRGRSFPGAWRVEAVGEDEGLSGSRWWDCNTILHQDVDLGDLSHLIHAANPDIRVVWIGMEQK